MRINLKRIEHMLTIEEFVAAGVGTLNKHADPIEGHRSNLTQEQAEEIAREDAGLIYLHILDIYGFGDLLNDLNDEEPAYIDWGISRHACPPG